jgi:RNA polymerase sigma-70 factor (ECF subfamily)
VNTTSLTLLERLHQPDAHEAWSRFVNLYTPLLYHWARSVLPSEQDPSDLVQEVLLLLVQKLPEFAYDRQKSFRGWLRTVLVNKWREQQRKRTAPMATGQDLSDVEGPEEGPTLEEKEYREYLVRRALQIMQSEFESATWQACWESVVASRPAVDVAEELGISVNAVYLAKSRVLRRLHQELCGLLD